MITAHIALKEALQALESGAPCTATWVNFDKARPQKNGKISSYEVEFMGRSAGDYEHYTRHVRILENGQRTAIVRELHPPLLIAFDGKTVVP